MFIKTRLSILLTLTLLILGCGTKKYVTELFGGTDNSEPPSPLVDFVETANINRIWSENVGKGTDELFIKIVPAILDNQIYIADTRGNIAALDSMTGESIWYKDSELPITGGTGADVNLIMVGTSEGEVVSLSPGSGEELWRAKVSSEILSSPRESDDIVITRTIDGKIFALDAITGERLWVYDRTVPALTLHGTSTPVIVDELVIAGFDGGRVAALQLKTGKLIWERRIAIPKGRSELERMIDIDAQPLIVDGIIYVTTFQANVTALLLESGQILWQRNISSHAELSADGNNLYVTDDEGHVWALDRRSGDSIWKQERLYARKITGPAVLGNKIIVGDLEGYLHWLDKETGQFAARVRVSDKAILTKAITVNDVLFGYASDGTLSAYSYADNAIIAPKQSMEREQPEQSTNEIALDKEDKPSE